MSNKKVNLLIYFLKNSPATRYNQFTSFFNTGASSKSPTPLLKNDEDYVSEFLDRIEVFGPSAANLCTYKNRIPVKDNFQRIFPQMRVMRKPSSDAWKEPQQLLESIRMVSLQSGGGLILYQELEQRLEIASPEALATARIKLIYLFKVLLTKREKLELATLEHDANLSLSRAIIVALSRAQTENDQQNWRQLDAMEKLLAAREHHQKGQRDIAMNSFEQICRNQAASAKTRLQALQVLCSSGEELGDTRVLQSLASEMQAMGEKEYEEILLKSIRRIKSKTE